MSTSRVNVSLLSLLVLVTLHQGYSQDFGYTGNLGPSHWGEKYSSCVGKHQSPIDISEHNVKLVKLDPLVFENFDEIPYEATLTNNGHTVMLQLKCTEMPYLSGGPLSGTYRFAQLHFHWGENDEEGSENTINNSSFPMELHMVFYKTDYGNASEAMQYPDGLTVLAILYTLSPENNTNYDSILSALPEVENPGTTVTVPKISNLESLLMTDRKEYFTYDGSLTTPPCSEVVTWIEFKKPIALAHEQLEIFRNLNNEEGKMTHNFRPTQPLYDRVIYFNRENDINDIDNNRIDENNANSNDPVGHRSSSSQIKIDLILFSTIFLTIFKIKFT